MGLVFSLLWTSLHGEETLPPYYTSTMLVDEQYGVAPPPVLHPDADSGFIAPMVHPNAHLVTAARLARLATVEEDARITATLQVGSPSPSPMPGGR